VWGKTRLVQALFDARVGKNPLDPSLVIYTDMNDNPSPQPTGMVSDLIASRTRAIVVIDNCAPDLHRRITQVCRASESLISAITVEYDVREDEPEGTEVFRLEPSSSALVSRLISRRYPAMTRLDVDKIAEFSGGNARLALILANRLERHESVAGLPDEELFRRLFHQRQEHDHDLLKAAQACALLYSFQGESLTGDDAELPKIASLVGMNAQELFAKVAQLEQRDLVQSRSVWRAILPHAIANRLAKMALREIPLELIEAQFNTERLMKSFSRRLGYLHESVEAKCIAEKWLAKNGQLADAGTLNELGLAVFSNVAPVSPEATLVAIERALSGENASGLINEERTRGRIGIVLRSIAYDAFLFDRCVAAMIPLALVEPPDDRSHLEGLFHIVRSGTHATIEQRVRVAEDLLRSNDPGMRSLGSRLLKALLKSGDFEATHSFEFGARIRDYGYWPTSCEEKAHWFATTLQLARQFASKNDEFARTIRSTVAQSLWSVWFLGPDVQEQFEAIASEIATSDYWQEGWIAVRFRLSRPLDKANAAGVQRLRTFERRLRPKNIAEQVRAIVLTRSWSVLDYAEMDDDGEFEPERPMAAYEKAYAAAEELGKTVCSDQTVFTALLPELVTGDGIRLFPLGRGLSLASADQRRIWDQLTQAVAATEQNKRNVDALKGFLNGVSMVDQQLCEALLEEALEHETLGPWFPDLQSSVTISLAGARRLKRAVTLGKAQAGAFYFLGFRPNVSAHDLRVIVLSLANKAQGYKTAIDILSMRLQSDQNQKKEYPSELIDAGRELLSAPDFSVRDNLYGYHLHTIATRCLCGSGGSIAARSLCERIKNALTDYTFHAHNYEQLLQSIFELQPRIALDVFFDTPQTNGSNLDFDLFDDPSDRRMNPLDRVPVEEMLRWCNEKPVEHYPAIAQAVSYYTDTNEGGAEWTPLALELLKRAPDPVIVLKKFVGRFYPKVGWRSLAAIIESRLRLLDRLGDLRNAAIEDYVNRIRPQFVDAVAQMRKSEDERDSARDERFE
jgi:hypothetical protein